MNRVFIIDAFAIIYRSYFTFIKNPRVTSKGFNTSAIMGFTSFLIELIKKERPTHIAVAFDPPGPTFRQEEYTDYKANREETPEAISLGVPYIKKILRDLKIPILIEKGFEADDVIGSLVSILQRSPKTSCYMVTPDKDFAQLVTQNVFMYKPRRFGNGIEILGRQEVLEKFEVREPKRVIDYLALVGDSVDNIPGVPGVGDKTAKRLLKEFESLEGVIHHTEKLKGKLKERVSNNKSLALLSQKLATIVTDIDLKVQLEDLVLSRNPNLKSLLQTYDELEFKTLKQKTLSVFSEPTSLFFNEQISTQKDQAEPEESNNINGIKDISSQKHFYQIVDSIKFAQLLCQKLLQQKEVALDTETSSLNTREANLIGISISYATHSAYYIPVTSENGKSILEALIPFFESEGVLKIGHNLKFDLQVLENHGIIVKGQKFDTMIAHYLLAPESSHKMDTLSQELLSYQPIRIEELIGDKKATQISMDSVNVEKLAPYACEDADITFQLKGILEKKLIKERLLELFNQVEMPLMEVLSSMEQQGIQVNPKSFKKQSQELTKELTKVQEKIFEISGSSFLISSPKQLGSILFERLKISDNPSRTKTGQYATSEEVLRKIRGLHPIIDQILRYRSLQKLISTYTDALPHYISPQTNKIHTHLSQTITATGRISSSRPNLQNIPILSSEGRKIRQAFIPSYPDYILTSADYSQIELRIIAEISQEPTMIKAFKDDLDIHTTTAAKIFEISDQEVTPEQRQQAKTVNFGIIYGVSAFGLSQQTQLSVSQSKKIISSYFETFPRLTAYMEQQITLAQQNGFVCTLLGRKRYIPDISSRNRTTRKMAERIAINTPIQGSAADLIKIAMIKTHDSLQQKKLQSKLILQIHDELLVDGPRSEAVLVSSILKNEMENAFPSSVKLKVNISSGDNWSAAH